MATRTAAAPSAAPHKRYRLTERQAAFARCIVSGLSAAEAARQAGYSPRTADKLAYQLLENPRVVDKLDELRAQLEADAILTGTEVLQHLSGIVRQEITAIVQTRDGAVETTASIPDMIRALELLGKRWKLFDDRTEHRGAVTIRVVRD